MFFRNFKVKFRLGKFLVMCITGEFALQSRMPRKTGLIAPIRIFQCFFLKVVLGWNVD
jgi:hypothetical protein